MYPDEKDVISLLKPKIKIAVRETLIKFFENQNETTTDPDSILFTDINDLEEDSFQNFTFSDASINLYFSPYDIAPYVVGPIVAQIER